SVSWLYPWLGFKSSPACHSSGGWSATKAASAPTARPNPNRDHDSCPEAAQHADVLERAEGIARAQGRQDRLADGLKRRLWRLEGPALRGSRFREMAITNLPAFRSVKRVTRNPN